MSDPHSKVTLRPRSKLERLVAALDPDGESEAPRRISLARASEESESLAPDEGALRVAVRVGYPGSTLEAVTRALDAEIPEGHASVFAPRARRTLSRHASDVCVLLPRCASCVIRPACDFHGEGADPERRLARPRS